MNAHRHPDQFDAQARQWHADSLQSLSPATLSRLRAARHASSQPQRHTRRWLLGSLGSATLAIALVFGLQLHQPSPPASGMSTSTAAATAFALDDDADLLDQNPDLYVWLGSDNSL